MSSTVNQRNWYIVHTYSGFEERVKETLGQRAEALGMGEAFGEIKIPTETIVEYKGGKKREVQRKFFPGYILVEMEMSDPAWHVVKNTPKVTGFVGNAVKPPPISEAEVRRLTQQITEGIAKPTPKVEFEVGDQVRVIDGPFANFNGSIEEVKPDKQKVRVLVSIFG